MEFVLGIDLGTSYFKLGLFDRKGNLRGLGRVAVEKDTADGSLCKLPTGRFWQLLRRGLKNACEQAEANLSSIKAVSYSSQANSFVLLDKNDNPLTPLILWPDERATQIYPEVKQLWQRDDFLQTTGLGIECSNRLCINKLLWFKENLPNIWEKINRIMTISDYFTFSLTGSPVGDTGTASLLGLLDVRNKEWWDEALSFVGIEKSKLSTPLLPGTIVGTISKEGSELLKLEQGTIFAVGSLDHHSAAIGAGIGAIAQLSESTGTVLACVNFNKKFQPEANCCTGPAEINSYYQLAFSDNGAGTLQWYQKNYAPNMTIEELIKSAESVEIGCEGLAALPCADRYNNLDGFRNISDRYSHGHFARAIMESTAACLKKLVSNLCDGQIPEQIAATGGGAKSDLWLQMKADLLATEVITTNCAEPACRGAAMQASIAVKWFNGLKEASNSWISVKDCFRPDPDRSRKYSDFFDRYAGNILVSRKNS